MVRTLQRGRIKGKGGEDEEGGGKLGRIKSPATQRSDVLAGSSSRKNRSNLGTRRKLRKKKKKGGEREKHERKGRAAKTVLGLFCRPTGEGGS